MLRHDLRQMNFWESTRSQIEVEKNAAKESLKMAIRDTELMLESKLKARFADHVKHLISSELEDKEFLKQLILKVAGSSCSNIPEDKDLDLVVAKEKLGPSCFGVIRDCVTQRNRNKSI